MNSRTRMDALKNALRKAFADNSKGLEEEVALEAAAEVADFWQARLEEIVHGDDDDEEEDFDEEEEEGEDVCEFCGNDPCECEDDPCPDCGCEPCECIGDEEDEHWQEDEEDTGPDEDEIEEDACDVCGAMPCTCWKADEEDEPCDVCGRTSMDHTCKELATCDAVRAARPKAVPGRKPTPAVEPSTNKEDLEDMLSNAITDYHEDSGKTMPEVLSIAVAISQGWLLRLATYGKIPPTAEEAFGRWKSATPEQRQTARAELREVIVGTFESWRKFLPIKEALGVALDVAVLWHERLTAELHVDDEPADLAVEKFRKSMDPELYRKLSTGEFLPEDEPTGDYCLSCQCLRSFCVCNEQREDEEVDNPEAGTVPVTDTRSTGRPRGGRGNPPNHAEDVAGSPADLAERLRRNPPAGIAPEPGPDVQIRGASSGDKPRVRKVCARCGAAACDCCCPAS